MNGLLEQFLTEAADLLDQVDSGLLALEQDGADRESLDRVFRAAHTIKGSSGLFDLPQLTRLTHAAEDLLDAVRAGQVELAGEQVDDLLAAFDLVRTWLGAVGRTGALPPDATTTGAHLAARLREPLGGEAPGAEARVPTPRAPADDEVPDAPTWLPELFDRESLTGVRDWLRHAGGTCRVVRYLPAEGCFFTGEDPLFLVSQVPAVETLAVRPVTPWPDPVDLDEYRCNLIFGLVTRATLAELDHLFRYVPDEVQWATVDADSLDRLLDPPAAPDAVSAVLDRARAAALTLLDAQRRALRVEVAPEQRAVRIASVVGVVTGVLKVLGRPAEDFAELAARCRVDGDCEPLLHWLDALLAEPADDSETTGAQEDPGPLELDADTGTAGTAGTAGIGGVEAADVAGRPPLDRRVATRRAGDREEGENGGGRQNRVLKVDQLTVDRLLDLVGQLVVAKNGLPFLATAAEEEWGARPLARALKDQYAVVNRITEELQTAVMDVRMLPMSVAFARFPRLVRDLARSLGKDVRLERSGEDTAADKDVIEMLGDPLVHLVRNSLDHGIETPEDRRAAGKPEQAVLRIGASQEPDAVVVDIVDDGRGIDPDRVRRKAYERGLITEEQVDQLSDAEAVNLVFRPGFSTAEAISDVSGRGVGMDAVRAVVEAAGGSVRLTSTLGEGTHVQLRVPLSMAVSQVMIVTVGGQRFGVPVDLVIETVRVPRERVTRIQHQDVVVLRDSVIPLMDLATELQFGGSSTDEQHQVSVLVTRSGGQDVGLVVEGFHEGAEVIVKPMEGILAGTRQYCGTALMGDGSVLLVVDVKEVLAGARAGR